NTHRRGHRILRISRDYAAFLTDVVYEWTNHGNPKWRTTDVGWNAGSLRVMLAMWVGPCSVPGSDCGLHWPRAFRMENHGRSFSSDAWYNLSLPSSTCIFLPPRDRNRYCQPFCIRFFDRISFTLWETSFPFTLPSGLLQFFNRSSLYW